MNSDRSRMDSDQSDWEGGRRDGETRRERSKARADRGSPINIRGEAKTESIPLAQAGERISLNIFESGASNFQEKTPAHEKSIKHEKSIMGVAPSDAALSKASGVIPAGRGGSAKHSAINENSIRSVPSNEKSIRRIPSNEQATKKPSPFESEVKFSGEDGDSDVRSPTSPSAAGGLKVGDEKSTIRIASHERSMGHDEKSSQKSIKKMEQEKCFKQVKTHHEKSFKMGQEKSNKFLSGTDAIPAIPTSPTINPISPTVNPNGTSNPNSSLKSASRLTVNVKRSGAQRIHSSSGFEEAKGLLLDGAKSPTASQRANDYSRSAQPAPDVIAEKITQIAQALAGNIRRAGTTAVMSVGQKIGGDGDDGFSVKAQSLGVVNRSGIKKNVSSSVIGNKIPGSFGGPGGPSGTTDFSSVQSMPASRQPTFVHAKQLLVEAGEGDKDGTAKERDGKDPSKVDGKLQVKDGNGAEAKDDKAGGTNRFKDFGKALTHILFDGMEEALVKTRDDAKTPKAGDRKTKKQLKEEAARQNSFLWLGGWQKQEVLALFAKPKDGKDDTTTGLNKSMTQSRRDETNFPTKSLAEREFQAIAGNKNMALESLVDDGRDGASPASRADRRDVGGDFYVGDNEKGNGGVGGDKDDGGALPFTRGEARNDTTPLDPEKGKITKDVLASSSKEPTTALDRSGKKQVERARSIKRGGSKGDDQTGNEAVESLGGGNRGDTAGIGVEPTDSLTINGGGGRVTQLTRLPSMALERVTQGMPSMALGGFMGSSKLSSLRSSNVSKEDVKQLKKPNIFDMHGVLQSVTSAGTTDKAGDKDAGKGSRHNSRHDSYRAKKSKEKSADNGETKNAIFTFFSRSLSGGFEKQESILQQSSRSELSEEKSEKEKPPEKENEKPTRKGWFGLGGKKDTNPLLPKKEATTPSPSSSPATSPALSPTNAERAVEIFNLKKAAGENAAAEKAETAAAEKAQTTALGQTIQPSPSGLGQTQQTLGTTQQTLSTAQTRLVQTQQTLAVSAAPNLGGSIATIAAVQSSLTASSLGVSQSSQSATSPAVKAGNSSAGSELHLLATNMEPSSEIGMEPAIDSFQGCDKARRIVGDSKETKQVEDTSSPKVDSTTQAAVARTEPTRFDCAGSDFRTSGLKPSGARLVDTKASAAPATARGESKDGNPSLLTTERLESKEIKPLSVPVSARGEAPLKKSESTQDALALNSILKNFRSDDAHVRLGGVGVTGGGGSRKQSMLTGSAATCHPNRGGSILGGPRSGSILLVGKNASVRKQASTTSNMSSMSGILGPRLGGSRMIGSRLVSIGGSGLQSGEMGASSGQMAVMKQSSTVSTSSKIGQSLQSLRAILHARKQSGQAGQSGSMGERISTIDRLGLVRKDSLLARDASINSSISAILGQSGKKKSDRKQSRQSLKSSVKQKSMGILRSASGKLKLGSSALGAAAAGRSSADGDEDKKSDGKESVGAAQDAIAAAQFATSAEIEDQRINNQLEDEIRERHQVGKTGTEDGEGDEDEERDYFPGEDDENFQNIYGEEEEDESDKSYEEEEENFIELNSLHWREATLCTPLDHVRNKWSARELLGEYRHLQAPELVESLQVFPNDSGLGMDGEEGEYDVFYNEYGFYDEDGNYVEASYCEYDEEGNLIQYYDAREFDEESTNVIIQYVDEYGNPVEYDQYGNPTIHYEDANEFASEVSNAYEYIDQDGNLAIYEYIDDDGYPCDEYGNPLLGQDGLPLPKHDESKFANDDELKYDNESNHSDSNGPEASNIGGKSNFGDPSFFSGPTLGTTTPEVVQTGFVKEDEDLGEGQSKRTSPDRDIHGVPSGVPSRRTSHDRGSPSTRHSVTRDINPGSSTGGATAKHTLDLNIIQQGSGEGFSGKNHGNDDLPNDELVIVPIASAGVLAAGAKIHRQVSENTVPQMTKYGTNHHYGTASSAGGLLDYIFQPIAEKKPLNYAHSSRPLGIVVKTSSKRKSTERAELVTNSLRASKHAGASDDRPLTGILQLDKSPIDSARVSPTPSARGDVSPTPSFQGALDRQEDSSVFGGKTEKPLSGGIFTDKDDKLNKQELARRKSVAVREDRESVFIGDMGQLDNTKQVTNEADIDAGGVYGTPIDGPRRLDRTSMYRKRSLPALVVVNQPTLSRKSLPANTVIKPLDSLRDRKQSHSGYVGDSLADRKQSYITSKDSVGTLAQRRSVVVRKSVVGCSVRKDGKQESIAPVDCEKQEVALEKRKSFVRDQHRIEGRRSMHNIGQHQGRKSLHEIASGRKSSYDIHSLGQQQRSMGGQQIVEGRKSMHELGHLGRQLFSGQKSMHELSSSRKNSIQLPQRKESIRDLPGGRKSIADLAAFGRKSIIQLQRKSIHDLSNVGRQVAMVGRKSIREVSTLIPVGNRDVGKVSSSVGQGEAGQTGQAGQVEGGGGKSKKVDKVTSVAGRWKNAMKKQRATIIGNPDAINAFLGPQRTVAAQRQMKTTKVLSVTSNDDHSLAGLSKVVRNTNKNRIGGGVVTAAPGVGLLGVIDAKLDGAPGPGGPAEFLRKDDFATIAGKDRSTMKQQNTPFTKHYDPFLEAMERGIEQRGGAKTVNKVSSIQHGAGAGGYPNQTPTDPNKPKSRQTKRLIRAVQTLAHKASEKTNEPHRMIHKISTQSGGLKAGSGPLGLAIAQQSGTMSHQQSGSMGQMGSGMGRVTSIADTGLVPRRDPRGDPRGDSASHTVANLSGTNELEGEPRFDKKERFAILTGQMDSIFGTGIGSQGRFGESKNQMPIVGQTSVAHSVGGQSIGLGGGLGGGFDSTGYVGGLGDFPILGGSAGRDSGMAVRDSEIPTNFGDFGIGSHALVGKTATTVTVSDEDSGPGRGNDSAVGILDDATDRKIPDDREQISQSGRFATLDDVLQDMETEKAGSPVIHLSTARSGRAEGGATSSLGGIIIASGEKPAVKQLSKGSQDRTDAGVTGAPVQSIDSISERHSIGRSKDRVLAIHSQSKDQVAQQTSKERIAGLVAASEERAAGGQGPTGGQGASTPSPRAGASTPSPGAGANTQSSAAGASPQFPWADGIQHSNSMGRSFGETTNTVAVQGSTAFELHREGPCSIVTGSPATSGQLPGQVPVPDGGERFEIVSTRIVKNVDENLKLTANVVQGSAGSNSAGPALSAQNLQNVNKQAFQKYQLGVVPNQPMDRMLSDAGSLSSEGGKPVAKLSGFTVHAVPVGKTVSDRPAATQVSGGIQIATQVSGGLVAQGSSVGIPTQTSDGFMVQTPGGLLKIMTPQTVGKKTSERSPIQGTLQATKIPNMVPDRPTEDRPTGKSELKIRPIERPGEQEMLNLAKMSRGASPMGGAAQLALNDSGAKAMGKMISDRPADLSPRPMPYAMGKMTPHGTTSSYGYDSKQGINDSVAALLGPQGISAGGLKSSFMGQKGPDKSSLPQQTSVDRQASLSQQGSLTQQGSLAQGSLALGQQSSLAAQQSWFTKVKAALTGQRNKAIGTILPVEDSMAMNVSSGGQHVSGAQNMSMQKVGMTIPFGSTAADGMGLPAAGVPSVTASTARLSTNSTSADMAIANRECGQVSVTIANRESGLGTLGIAKKNSVLGGPGPGDVEGGDPVRDSRKAGALPFSTWLHGNGTPAEVARTSGENVKPSVGVQITSNRGGDQISDVRASDGGDLTAVKTPSQRVSGNSTTSSPDGGSNVRSSGNNAADQKVFEERVQIAGNAFEVVVGNAADEPTNCLTGRSSSLIDRSISAFNKRGGDEGVTGGEEGEDFATRAGKIASVVDRMKRLRNNLVYSHHASSTNYTILTNYSLLDVLPFMSNFFLTFLPAIVMIICVPLIYMNLHGWGHPSSTPLSRLLGILFVWGLNFFPLLLLSVGMDHTLLAKDGKAIAIFLLLRNILPTCLSLWIMIELDGARMENTENYITFSPLYLWIFCPLLSLTRYHFTLTEDEEQAYQLSVQDAIEADAEQGRRNIIVMDVEDWEKQSKQFLDVSAENRIEKIGGHVNRIAAGIGGDVNVFSSQKEDVYSSQKDVGGTDRGPDEKIGMSAVKDMDANDKSVVKDTGGINEANLDVSSEKISTEKSPIDGSPNGSQTRVATRSLAGDVDKSKSRDNSPTTSTPTASTKRNSSSMVGMAVQKTSSIMSTPSRSGLPGSQRIRIPDKKSHPNYRPGERGSLVGSVPGTSSSALKTRALKNTNGGVSKQSSMSKTHESAAVEKGSSNDPVVVTSSVDDELFDSKAAVVDPNGDAIGDGDVTGDVHTLSTIPPTGSSRLSRFLLCFSIIYSRLQVFAGRDIPRYYQHFRHSHEPLTFSVHNLFGNYSPHVRALRANLEFCMAVLMMYMTVSLPTFVFRYDALYLAPSDDLSKFRGAVLLCSKGITLYLLHLGVSGMNQPLIRLHAPMIVAVNQGLLLALMVAQSRGAGSFMMFLFFNWLGFFQKVFLACPLMESFYIVRTWRGYVMEYLVAPPRGMSIALFRMALMLNESRVISVCYISLIILFPFAKLMKEISGSGELGERRQEDRQYAMLYEFLFPNQDFSMVMLTIALCQELLQDFLIQKLYRIMCTAMIRSSGRLDATPEIIPDVADSLFDFSIYLSKWNYWRTRWTVAVWFSVAPSCLCHIVDTGYLLQATGRGVYEGHGWGTQDIYGNRIDPLGNVISTALVGEPPGGG